MSKINAYGDEENIVMTLDDWNSRWKKKHTAFHLPKVNENLVKHENVLLDKQKMSVFVPLCGKTIDMKYIADKGHKVVGLECSEIAIHDFFNEHNIKFNKTKHPTSDFNIFQSEDSSVTIYQGNLFLFNSDVSGKLDATWDRGAFVAINPSQRGAYFGVMSEVMKVGAKYLLNTFRYDPTKYCGPPFSIEDQEIAQLSENRFTITALGEFEAINDRQRSWGLDSFVIRNNLLVKM
uniref:thiopurine S-methyltransferase n=1 Tax=Ciona intestinalis TaxID=7719 RepID=UPI000180AFA1|nr:thiopurine S-methyltransferase [Ciona intestinalis]|eukprot:XP_002126407.1 thiopurine S-methyltransferase [Ciona intestinalis]